MRTLRTFPAALLIGALAAGCAAEKSYVTTSDFPEAGRAIRKVGVVVAEARLLDLSVGHVAAGVTGAHLVPEVSKNVEGSERCLPLAEAAAVRSLSDRGYEAVLFAYDEEIRTLVAEYAPVRERLAGAFLDKKPIEIVPPMPRAQQVAAARGVDAIAFVSVRDLVGSKGRKFLTALFYGSPAVHVSGGRSEAELALLDAAGRPIYFDVLREEGNLDWSDDEDIVELCGKLTAGLARRE